MAGIIIGVLALVAIVGGLAYYVKNRFTSTPNSHNSGNPQLGDTVQFSSFNNPLSDDTESAYDTINQFGSTKGDPDKIYNNSTTGSGNEYTDPFSTPTPAASQQPRVEGNILFFGSDA